MRDVVFGRDIKQEMDVIREKAAQGDAEVQCRMGVNYYHGIGEDKNPKQAVQWFQKSAEQGYAEAQYALGKCYDLGDGIRKSYKNEILKEYPDDYTFPEK